MDSYTEINKQNIFSRMVTGIKGIFIGLFLLIISTVLLWWNEGNYVENINSLEKGEELVKKISKSEIKKENENKLVYLTGKTKTNESLTDNQFNIKVNDAIKLIRKVQMYQWVEHKRTRKSTSVGGTETTETTYEYKKEWKERYINSNNFKKVSYHENPQMYIKNEVFKAQSVKIGKFILSETLTNKINKKIIYQVSNNKIKDFKIINNGYYKGDNPSYPKVGDLKIQYFIVKNQEISIIAQQSGEYLVPFRTSENTTIELLEEGKVNTNEMFKKAKSSEKIKVWLIRLAGMILMFIGLSMMMSLLPTIISILPFLGSIATFGVSLISIILTILLSFIIIAIAWFFYRPLISIIILIFGILPIFLLGYKKDN